MNTPKLPPLPEWFESASEHLKNDVRNYAIAAIEAQCVPDGLRSALQRIADWKSHDLQLAVDRGFNGVRDFYRQIAIDALASAPPAPQATRCELCQYQHGHQIGCANNLVDIALKAQAQQWPFPGWEVQQEHDVVSYVVRWGGNCRDCADEGGVCPGSGLPCGGARKAIEHVLKALRYGVQQGYIRDPLASAQQAKPQPLNDEQVDRLYEAAVKARKFVTRQDFELGIRAAEAAHGIKE